MNRPTTAALALTLAGTLAGAITIGAALASASSRGTAGKEARRAAPSAAPGGAAPLPLPPPPATPKKPVVDQYRGTAVTDDYRWLQDWSDPEVRRWSDAQNSRARQFLDHLPSVAEIRKRVTQLENAPSTDYTDLTYRRGTLFALKVQPPKEQPLLVSLKPDASDIDPRTERVILDPNRLDPKGGASIDFYVPSLDGRLVAVSLSSGGSESGDVSVYEAASGRKLSDSVLRVNGGTAGGSLAWNGDGSGFYYTRYPRPGERPPEDLFFYQQVWFHKLGTPSSQDAYSIGKEFPRIAEILLRSSDDGRYLLARVANGDGGDFALYLLGPAGSWTRIADFPDRAVAGRFGTDGDLYLLSLKGAPRGRILRLTPAAASLESASEVVPEGEDAIEEFEATSRLLFIVRTAGGPERLAVRRRGDGSESQVPLKPISSISHIERLGGDDVIFRSETYLEPPAWSRYSAATGDTVRTSLFRTSPARFDDTEVVREFATSPDGTRVPVNVIRLKGTPLNHSNPTLLTGYGGFGFTLAPFFSDARRAWIEQGGVLAIANLRGGGEHGDGWHREGSLTRKQNVFDDFAACARYMVEAGYTSREKLAIEGGSNGGLLMGASLTQHPDLCRAVVSHVGIYDMLRVELTPNGSFNVTEYGTVREADQFRALYAYSPYHHVVDGTTYPAVLFLTGANDPRVDPMHSRKMVARLGHVFGGARPAPDQLHERPRDRHGPQRSRLTGGGCAGVPLPRAGRQLHASEPGRRPSEIAARVRGVLEVRIGSRRDQRMRISSRWGVPNSRGPSGSTTRSSSRPIWTSPPWESSTA